LGGGSKCRDPSSDGHSSASEPVGTLRARERPIERIDSTHRLPISNIATESHLYYKSYINDGKTIVTSPHKVFGPESNDLVLQLRKAGINQVILAGMSANLCVESHMRELVEQGFKVVIAADATAAAKLPGYDGYEAAFVNYRMIASDVWSTAETVGKLSAIK